MENTYFLKYFKLNPKKCIVITVIHNMESEHTV